MDRPSNDQILATAAHVLFDDGNLDAVNLLLSCDLETTWSSEDEDDSGLNFTLRGPYLVVRDYRKNQEELDDQKHKTLQQIMNVFRAVLPRGYYMADLYFGITMVEVKENWRAELLEAIRGGNIHNQATGTENSKIRIWESLRFRSASELKLAQALDNMGTLFFPNCKARLGAITKRELREPDFLICHNGKWGILEVDGEPYHPASRTVQDHARDRLFRMHGIVLIEHYDSQECYNHPDKVVKEFLSNLARA